MNKKLLMLLLSAMLILAMVVGCGKKDAEEPETTEPAEEIEMQVIEETEPVEESVPLAEVPEGMYRSELTNECIDESLMTQRPVAIMVDNEKTALDHYGLTQADIIYEMMNSTLNDEITRFMCVVKDWESITRFGSIRSVRPTNFMIAPEYNAIVIHDGGPFYINAFLENPWVDHLSGGFARIENGKAREFTEYVTTGEIASRIEANGIDRNYNSYHMSRHWTFSDPNAPTDLSKADGSIDCTTVDLPFHHNGSELNYDPESGTYLYSEYGKPHIDLENGNKQLAFTNVVIQCASHTQYDDNGYMQFNIINSSGDGYYITGGKAIPVTWAKTHDCEPTKFFDAAGNEIILNTGKTYVGLVSTSRWEELVIK